LLTGAIVLDSREKEGDGGREERNTKGEQDASPSPIRIRSAFRWTLSQWGTKIPQGRGRGARTTREYATYSKGIALVHCPDDSGLGKVGCYDYAGHVTYNHDLDVARIRVALWARSTTKTREKVELKGVEVFRSHVESVPKDRPVYWSGWEGCRRVSWTGMMEGKGRSRRPSDVWPYCASVENRSNLNDAPLSEGRGLILQVFPTDNTVK
jgi:hypothetical protein